MRVPFPLLAITAALSVGCADVPTSSSPLEPTAPSRIVSGVPDAGQHPYVVVLVFSDGENSAWLCSGSLLSSTVVLTAGHCTDGAVTARAYTNETLTSPLVSFPGTPYTYSQFCIACGSGLPGFLQGDVGIVVLSRPVPTSVVGEYAQLPTPGQVDALAKGSTIDLVGYGVDKRFVGGGPPVWDWEGDITRKRATAQLVSGQFVNSGSFIRLSGNAAQGKGTTCFGDSGGPGLIGGTDTVIALTSYGSNGNCAGVSYSFRIDTPDVLAWIQSFL
jgi:secreted trypsin-like serine protease